MYSIVENCVRLDLFDVSSDLFVNDISAQLIKLQLAERIEEPPISQVNTFS